MPDFLQQSSYSYQQLIECANGKLFGEGNARLPAPPMLMFDRITHIADKGGEFNQRLYSGRTRY